MQIEFLFNEFSIETNEMITIVNLIDHEYIERCFLFKKKIMQFYFPYIYDRKIWIVKHIINLIFC
jgi:hypothetical protein